VDIGLGGEFREAGIIAERPAVGTGIVADRVRRNPVARAPPLRHIMPDAAASPAGKSPQEPLWQTLSLL
jgi:hypothetical protein